MSRSYGATPTGLAAQLRGGATAALREPAKYRGHQGDAHAPSVLLLCNHGLHVEVHIDRTHPSGAATRAGIADLVLESALTTIQDCEDSVAAVDAEDKVAAYRNWLGLMRGTLEARVDKAQCRVRAAPEPGKRNTGADGAELVLPGRACMLVRNVGHHMITDMVTLDGQPCPRPCSMPPSRALIAMHDFRAR